MEGSEDRVLDPAASELAAREGMSKALHALRVQEWRSRADEWLNMMPVGREWTNDSLYIEIGNPASEANRNNAVGAWVSAQARAGRISFTGRMMKSRRKSRHSNLVRIWRKE